MGKETPTSAQQRKRRKSQLKRIRGDFKVLLDNVTSALRYAVGADSTGTTVVHRGGMLQDLLERCVQIDNSRVWGSGPSLPHIL